MKFYRQTLTRKTLQGVRAVALVSFLLGAANSLHAASNAPDLDGDGIPNIVDPDIDNDGIPNALDKNVDGGIAKSGPYKGKYIGDHQNNDNPGEKDIDADNQADDSLAEKDLDADGKMDDDSTELDIDGDGRADDSLAEKDIDGDGKNEDKLTEDDIDGDGLDDDDATEMDIDGDTLTNGTTVEVDTDGDGVLDNDPTEMDDDGDGRDDGDDDDDDNDGVSDGHDGDHRDEDGESESELSLTRLTGPSNSQANLEVRTKPSGRIRFEIELEGVTSGDYQLFVAGIERGLVHISGNEGHLAYETVPDDEGELVLDFEIYGQAVVIKKSGVDYFSGTVSAAGNGGGTAEAELDRTTNAPSGSEGKVTMTVATNGDVSVVIEAEDLALGTYTCKVAGSSVGTIEVTQNSGNGTRGRIKFATNPTGDQLPLTFEISGQPVTVEQNSTIYLSGTGPTP